MDIKASFDKYDKIIGVHCNIENIKKSISLIINSNVDYEFRTTVLKHQLSFDDFEKIGKVLQGAKRYYLQKFVSSNILDKNLINAQNYTDNELQKICINLKKYINCVDYR